MFPYFFQFNFIHRRPCDSIINGNYPIRSIVGTNSQHLLCCERSSRMPLPVHNIRFVTSLFDTILHIINVCPKKEMRRIYARRIIAIMQHPFVSWDWPVKCNPSSPMGVLNLPTSGANLTISVFHYVFLPNPTSSFFVHFDVFKDFISKCFHTYNIVPTWGKSKYEFAILY